ncbi:MAG: hypothetical protein JWM36_1624 [Hyphomicrobiales bacterium]|nr:hypothetical protein [Hyphomicrobiales bacterium]
MDEISVFVLLGLAAIVALILGPIGLFRAQALSRDVRAAELALLEVRTRLQRLEAAQARPGPIPESKPAEPDAVVPAAVPPPPPIAQAPKVPSAAPLAPVFAHRRSFEETLGTRWTVWVGGVALALGAVLLVRYSIERGLFGPLGRTFLGVLLAVALVAAGEWLRRRETGEPSAPAYIPGVLTAAGTIAAFATIWAAHALYGFIGAGPALVLLGATGVATMAAAALHGPALAGLGLIGAFATPMLVSSDSPSPWPVVLYLAVLAASAYGLARLRCWLWLAMASACGAAIWSLVLADSVGGDDPGGFLAAALLHVIVQTALGLFFVAYVPHRVTADEAAEVDVPSHLLAALFACIGVVTLHDGLAVGLFGTGWIAGAAAIIALLMVCAVRIAPAGGAAIAASFVSLLALRFWPAVDAPPLVISGTEFWTDLLVPRDPIQFSLFALAMCGGCALACVWRLFVGPTLRFPIAAIYAGVAGVTPLAALWLVFLRFTRGESSPAMAAVAAVFALVCIYLARGFLMHPRLRESDALRLGLGAMASAAIAALALGFVFALQGGTLTVALALAALGAAYVAARLEIPALRWCVCAFGAVLAARYAWDPRIAGAGLGRTPVFNWLLFGYGVPALAFASAAHIMRRRAEDLPVRIADACAVLFAALLVFFQIRHAINGGDPFARTSGLVEQGLMVFSGFLFSLVLMSLDARRLNPVFRIASLISGALGIAGAVIGLGFYANPFISFDPVEGGVVLNALLLGYALPGLAAFVLARRARALGRGLLATAAGITTIGLLFFYASLEVRRVFHDEHVGWLRSTSSGESYTYSAVWLVLGILLLAYGVWRQSREARIASAAFIVLTVLKVFLLDLQGLDGILRALSFLGLGAVLIGIGLVYQKVVFALPPGAGGRPQGQGPAAT